jgi:hypothetical protein
MVLEQGSRIAVIGAGIVEAYNSKRRKNPKPQPSRCGY